MSLSNFANGIHSLPTSSSSPASLRGSSFSPPSIVAYSIRRNMSSSSIRASTEMPPSLPPLPENRVVLGCRAVSVDFLATVASYPNPDDKIRSTDRRTRTSSPKSRASAVVSPSLPPLPESRIILGLGGTGLDFLVTVAAYPKPDEKIRSTSSKVQGGGNAGNALTCAARLGLNPRLISKVANDAQGKGILDELEGDGVDTNYVVVAEEGNSPFTYVIVDSQT
ncbi:PREDICTED: uncharacterized protein LOC104590874 isoform X2 [Nelumbo nucifera]|uniref:Uncharacterized protein LOC104590874 isoform X2 n=1 Tax=Nelumbo nucifera TaxID=4432 RepID=A0A1U8Q007_NELNU|nr:PREDICTED: uncharacterized protein LOC104590874 isoform X2 [Nelumbo nucifera]